MFYMLKYWNLDQIKMSFKQYSDIDNRNAKDKSIMFNPDAIRRRKQRMIDHSAVNYQMIIDHAMLTNLRTLKVFLFSRWLPQLLSLLYTFLFYTTL